MAAPLHAGSLTYWDASRSYGEITPDEVSLAKQGVYSVPSTTIGSRVLFELGVCANGTSGAVSVRAYAG